MNGFNRGILTILIIFLIIGSTIPVNGELFLTQEEEAYINKGITIKVASMNGVAPISYGNEDKEILGIARAIAEEISGMTGIQFEYSLYDSVHEILSSEADIILAIPENYAPPGMKLSQPLLESETILYINSSLKSDQLENKTYAAVRGSDLPEGIKEENSIYFDTREESINAVERGLADYGYGNAYSLAFYILENNYKNIITIPHGKESREYRIGFPNDNEELISIINKSLDAIDENLIHNLILEIASRVDRKITLPMIVEAYGGQLFAIILFVISILLFSTIANIRIKNNLKIQNKRYEILSEISNEYLYEYNGRYDHLQLSDKCIQLFGTGEVYNSVIKKLKNILLNNLQDDKILTVELPLIDGGIGVFKLINSSIYNNENKLDSIIGKLVDISEEFAERRRLITKSQIDGLTGLYNSVTSRKLITETIRNKDENKLDAFILLDCDNFKSINDNLGHLTGDEILIHIARSLEQVFRASDIIGRVGGDEFCVYMKEIPYPQFVKEKGQQLNDSIYERISKMKVSLSIGVELVNKVRSYEDIFVKADNALYSAKHNGGGQTVIYAIEGEDGI